MFISRFIKKKEGLYKNINRYLIQYHFDKIKISSLFLIWISVGSGFAVVSNSLYWNFLFSIKFLIFLILISIFPIIINYYSGITRIPLYLRLVLFLSLTMILIFIDDNFLSSSFIVNIFFLIIYLYFYNKNLNSSTNNKSLFYNVILCSSLFFLGLNINFIDKYLPLNSIYTIFPYVLTLISVLLLKPLYIISTNSDFKDHVIKSSLLIMLSIFLQTLSIIFSYFNNDPILSTSLAIIIPFYFVALFFPKGEHLTRAYIYPILILLIFISTRIPFLFLSFFILFHLLRLINYFLNGKIYPTFKITNDIPNF